MAAARADRRPPFTAHPAVARRSLLKGGLAALALAPLLQSCGDPGLAFSGVERIPAPDDPIRWDLSDKHEIIESGLTPEAGQHAADLQLRRLPLAAGAQELREEVRRRHPALDLQRRRRGADQDRHREPRVRPLLPELRLARPADHRRPAPAAQPGLHDQHRATCGPASATRGTTSAGCTRGRTRSTAPASAGAPTGSRRRSATATTPTTSSGTRVQGRPGDPRRLAHRDGHGAAAQRPRHEQHRRGRHRAWCASSCSTCGNTMRPEGDHRPVHRPARRPVRPEPDVVRRRDQHAVLPAGGHARSTSCATGSPRTARAASTTTWSSASRRARTRSRRTSSSTTCSTRASPRRTSASPATSRR